VQGRIALVHDYFVQYGGAERVVEVFHEIFPHAPVYTSIYSPDRMPPHFRSWDIRQSFLARLPCGQKRYLPLYPLAFRGLDLSEYEVVLSCSTTFGKGVRTGPETCHINYCCNTMRFAWDTDRYVSQEDWPGVIKWGVRLIAPMFRCWDRRASSGVDHFVVDSRVVQERVRRFYGREATIIHPPVDTSFYQPAEEVEDFFLVVSRLIPYKRVDLAVEAFNRLGWPLKIIGEGRDRPRLEGMAKPNIEFLGRISHEAVREHYARCRALVFPGEEDFGMAPIEVQACGRPVIAYRGGGALETVVEGVTGAFFEEQTPDSLLAVLEDFRAEDYDPARIRQQAEGFDVKHFRRAIYHFVEQAYQRHSLLVER